MALLFDPERSESDEKTLAMVIENEMYVNSFMLANALNTLPSDYQMEIRAMAKKMVAMVSKQESTTEAQNVTDQLPDSEFIGELDLQELELILDAISKKKMQDDLGSFARLDDFQRRLLFVKVLQMDQIIFNHSNFEWNLSNLFGWIDPAIKWLILMVGLFGIERWIFGWFHQRKLVESHPDIFNSLLFVGLLSVTWSLMVLFRKQIKVIGRTSLVFMRKTAAHMSGNHVL